MAKPRNIGIDYGSGRQEFEALFRLAVEAAPNALVKTDREGKIVLAEGRPPERILNNFGICAA